MKPTGALFLSVIAARAKHFRAIFRERFSTLAAVSARNACADRVAATSPFRGQSGKHLPALSFSVLTHLGHFRKSANFHQTAARSF
jgi:hypothetical protein